MSGDQTVEAARNRLVEALRGYSLDYVTPFEKAVREVERASESTLSIQHIAALKHHNKECGVCKELNKLMSQHMKPETRDNPNDVSRAKEQSNEAAERSYGH